MVSEVFLCFFHYDTSYPTGQGPKLMFTQTANIIKANYPLWNWGTNDWEGSTDPGGPLWARLSQNSNTWLFWTPLTQGGPSDTLSLWLPIPAHTLYSAVLNMYGYSPPCVCSHLKRSLSVIWRRNGGVHLLSCWTALATSSMSSRSDNWELRFWKLIIWLWCLIGVNSITLLLHSSLSFNFWACDDYRFTGSCKNSREIMHTFHPVLPLMAATYEILVKYQNQETEMMQFV